MPLIASARRAAVIAALLAPAAAQAQSAAPVTVSSQSHALTWSPCPAPFARGCEIAVVHGDPAQPNADIFLRVPGGFQLPPHTHSSAEHIVMIAGRLGVKYLDTPEWTLTPGDYAYGPAGRPHRATCLTQEHCVLFIAFESAIDAMAYSGSVD